jgi:hypothetical protein
MQLHSWRRPLRSHITRTFLPNRLPQVPLPLNKQTHDINCCMCHMTHGMYPIHPALPLPPSLWFPNPIS